MKTIDCTPTWQAALQIYLAALEHGNAEGKKAALQGLKQMATVAQMYVDREKDFDELIRITGDYLLPRNQKQLDKSIEEGKALMLKLTDNPIWKE